MFAFLGKLKRNLNSGANTIRFGKIADESRARGDIKKSLKLCRDGLDKYPSYATGHYILARCYLAEGQNTEAKESLAEALRLDPHHISVLSELAGIYQFENNNSQALYYYRQALVVDPLNKRIAFLIKSLSGEELLVPEPAPTVELVVDAVDEEIQSQEEPPATEVEPEALVVTETIDAAVPEPEPVIAPVAVACGPWVAELFQDYLPAVAMESRQVTSAEEQWPAVVFNAVMDLGRQGDAISFDTAVTTPPQEDNVSTVIAEELPAEEVVSEDEPAIEVEESPVFLVETEPEPEQVQVIDQVSKDNYLDQFFSDVAAAVGLPCASEETGPEASISEGPRVQNDDSEESEDRDPGEVEDDALSEAIPTATLAELYVCQGLIDRAISVYLTMKKHDPKNPDIQKRLSELFVMKSQREK